MWEGENLVEGQWKWRVVSQGRKPPGIDRYVCMKLVLSGESSSNHTSIPLFLSLSSSPSLSSLPLSLFPFVSFSPSLSIRLFLRAFPTWTQNTWYLWYTFLPFVYRPSLNHHTIAITNNRLQITQQNRVHALLDVIHRLWIVHQLVQIG